MTILYKLGKEISPNDVDIEDLSNQRIAMVHDGKPLIWPDHIRKELAESYVYLMKTLPKWEEQMSKGWDRFLIFVFLLFFGFLYLMCKVV